MITTRILAWYLSGLFALAALVESFISYTRLHKLWAISCRAFVC